MAERNTEPFKVIILGAGISGLLPADRLSRANIDFVVLEAYSDTFRLVGGRFGIWPNAARILDQVDCREDIENACEPLTADHVRRSNGSCSITSDIAARTRLEYEDSL